MLSATTASEVARAVGRPAATRPARGRRGGPPGLGTVVWIAAIVVIVGGLVTVRVAREAGTESVSFPVTDPLPPPPPPAPPSTLPPAGAVQPVDVAAAETGVRTAFAATFDAGVDPVVRTAAVQGGAGLGSTMAAVSAAFPEAAATTRTEVDEVVFTTDTEAFVRFHLRYEGAADLGDRIGRAVFAEGRWVVARDTACAVYAAAGVICPG